MQTRATHPKTVRREAKSDKKKEERIGAQLMAEITEPTDDSATAAAAVSACVSACVSDPAWKPSSSHLQPTWALQPERKCGGHGGGNHACAPAVDLAALSQLTAWVEQRHALDDVQFHATGAGTRTPAGGYDNGAARASSHPNVPQQMAEHAAAAYSGCEQHALNRVQSGATGGPAAASAAEDPKRALVHALQNDLSRMSLLLERLDELLSA